MATRVYMTSEIPNPQCWSIWDKSPDILRYGDLRDSYPLEKIKFFQYDCTIVQATESEWHLFDGYTDVTHKFE